MLVQGRPLVYRHHAFWRWWAVAQAAVRPDGVVVMPPAFDEDARFAQGIKHLCVEQLIEKAGMKLSPLPLSHGDHGVVNAVLAPTAPIKVRTVLRDMQRCHLSWGGSMGLEPPRTIPVRRSAENTQWFSSARHARTLAASILSAPSSG